MGSLDNGVLVDYSFEDVTTELDGNTARFECAVLSARSVDFIEMSFTSLFAGA